MNGQATNKILEDHSEWLLLDISTETFPSVSMAIDKSFMSEYKGGRIGVGRSNSTLYAKCSIDCVSTRLHKLVLPVDDGLEVDHISPSTRNFIDNRKSNLRAVTSSQNQMNKPVSSRSKSGVRGVYWDKYSNKWEAEIYADNKKFKLGRFKHIADAIDARICAEKKHFGEYRFSGA